MEKIFVFLTFLLFSFSSFANSEGGNKICNEPESVNFVHCYHVTYYCIGQGYSETRNECFSDDIEMDEVTELLNIIGEDICWD